MIYKFTSRAKKAIELAQDEAVSLGHNYIGTEHVLYGLIKEGAGVASRVLQNQGITAEDVEAKIVEMIGKEVITGTDTLGFTPRTKRVIENSFIEARKLGMKKIVVPIQNMKEASIVKDIEVLGAHNLQEVVKYINGEQELIKAEENMLTSAQRQTGINLDFSEVKGQENVKRALEVAASGGHNCLMIGMPGSGKTMMIRRLPTILPDLNFDEALETTKIHSVSGILEKDVSSFRLYDKRLSYNMLRDER